MDESKPSIKVSYLACSKDRRIILLSAEADRAAANCYAYVCEQLGPESVICAKIQMGKIEQELGNLKFLCTQRHSTVDISECLHRLQYASDMIRQQAHRSYKGRQSEQFYAQKHVAGLQCPAHESEE